MSSPGEGPFKELVDSLRSILTSSNHTDRCTDCISLTCVYRESHGQSGTLLWFSGGLQWIFTTKFTGPQDAASSFHYRESENSIYYFSSNWKAITMQNPFGNIQVLSPNRWTDLLLISNKFLANPLVIPLPMTSYTIYTKLCLETTQGQQSSASRQPEFASPPEPEPMQIESTRLSLSEYIDYLGVQNSEIQMIRDKKP
ncbi:hypothetical protein DPX16_0180 [Anabarilius grahami]|uniref:Uncharacterized protein n=1 Tax=Anabarilius grahami TaxID=495550 RepID=A0A3N0XMT0_ANAGA|nr:hypothetical protein DPX16_0180 [Anabarilius grahami]